MLLVPALYVAGLGLALLVQRTTRFNTVLRSMFFAPQMVSLVVVGADLADDERSTRSASSPRLLALFGIGGVSLLGTPSFALYHRRLRQRLVPDGLLHADLPRRPAGHPAGVLRGRAHRRRRAASQQFWYITLPLLRPTSFFVLLVSLVAAVAGGAGLRPDLRDDQGRARELDPLLIFYIYQQAFQYTAFGYAAAMASILVVSCCCSPLVLFLVTRGGRFQYD